MKKRSTANVATFKAHLSEYLRVVKTGGEVIVMDRHSERTSLIFLTHDKGLARAAQSTGLKVLGC